MQTNLTRAQVPAFESANYAPAAATAPTETQTEEINRGDRKTSENEPLKYQPHWITGCAKHPGLIVETPGLGHVAPPITYRSSLPHRLNDLGLISTFQFERIIYAGQAHEQRLPNGARGGISIGDGTGAGKTSTPPESF
jgi:hypothetical protein